MDLVPLFDHVSQPEAQKVLDGLSPVMTTPGRLLLLV